MSQRITGCLFLLFVYSTSNAHALVSGQFLFGKRYISTTHQAGKLDLSAWESTAALHIDPLPLIPVSFGLSYANAKIESQDVSFSVSKAYLREIGLELSAWVPLMIAYKPYLKLNVPVWSQLMAKTVGSNPQNIDTTVSGIHLNIGLKWQPIQFLSVLLEGRRSFEKAKVFAGKKREFNSYLISIGAEVAF